ARHDLEQVAAPEALLRLFDEASILARLVVAARRHLGSGFERFLAPLPRNVFGRKSAAGIVVAVVPCPGGVMVDDQNLIGQVKHEVPLAFRALEPELDGVELEGEIVSESAVEAE